jgi:hypothetical protein
MSIAKVKTAQGAVKWEVRLKPRGRGSKKSEDALTRSETLKTLKMKSDPKPKSLIELVFLVM